MTPSKPQDAPFENPTTEEAKARYGLYTPKTTAAPASGAAEVVTGEAGEIERLRAVLDNVADLAEEIRLDLVTHLDEPVRSAFWKGVKIRNLALSTLEASIATRPAAEGDDYE